jgi:hypothetical protein
MTAETLEATEVAPQRLSELTSRLSPTLGH